MKRFHSSLEAAQHGDKNLQQLLKFAGTAGFSGIQPSNYHLQKPDGSLMSAEEVRSHFTGSKVRLDGISAHCLFWVHTTAWTESKTIRPFLPADVAKKSPLEIEQWAETYLLKLMDLAADLNIHVIPMFWGIAFGWELATGYPWGFFSGGDYDLVREGQDRFVIKTKDLRSHAIERGISLAHEIHPGTAASCADDFLMLRQLCSGNLCMGVNADPSHCCEGESWEDRFNKVGPFITGCHVKDHVVRPGLPLRSMQADWKKRAMQFTRLGDGQIDLVRYSQLMNDVGYAKRYCEAHGTMTAPLVGEAESPYYVLDDVATAASDFIRNRLCTDFTGGSFEDGMGAK